MIRDAYVTADGLYRPWLFRQWDGSLPALCVCGLNPSKADAKVDDPSMLKIVGFAERNGYGTVYMVNLSDFRATDPADLFRAGVPISEACDVLITACCAGRDVLAAWGSNARRRALRKRAATVLQLLRQHGKRVLVLRQSPDGVPHHPLYLPYSLPLTPYVG